MKQDRFAGLFGNHSPENGNHPAQPSLRGFTTNPLADAVTAVQALMYQAAYQQAQADLREPDWPDAECWN